MDVALKDVCGISIEGRCFRKEVELEFFPNSDKTRLALVYGKNGSGKSTCTAGFKSCSAHVTDSQNLTVHLLNSENHEKMAMPEGGWQNVHVFDEEYVTQNLKIEGDGLQCVVLLGEQVEIDEKLKARENEKMCNVESFTNNESRINQLRDPSYERSPICIRKKIDDCLKAPNAWAEIEREIKGNRTSSKVDDKIFNELRELSVDESFESLQADFIEKRSVYNQVRMDDITYPTSILSISTLDNVDGRILEVLATTVEQPTLSERDKKIFDILTSHNNHREEIVTQLSNGITQCPYCFQEITSEYREMLLNSISNIFNEEANQFKAQIGKLNIPTIERDFSQFAKLDSGLCNQIQKKIQACNSKIAHYNQLLSQKQENIFVPIVLESLNLEECFRELNEDIQKLEYKRQEFMVARTKVEGLQTELISLNKKIYRKRLEELFLKYETAEKELNGAVQQKIMLERTIREKDDEITRLKQKKANVFIASEQINRDLEYVFFANNRIVLEAHNGCYSLKINGCVVKPEAVSTGERNAIALCYFFTQAFHNKDIKRAYSEESLFVIDDPVSSFDIGNRIGIISYLKHKAQLLIEGNANSKILVFSHDIVTVWDMEKAFSEFPNPNKGSLAYTIKELKNFGLHEFFSKRRNEYSNLMRQTYEFALEETGSSLEIGNIMRRMLEAFSTFLYRMGIEEISHSPKLEECFGEKSNYFKCLMYRLTLHGESHSVDAIRACADVGLDFHYTTDDEKQKIARSVLSMMYMLQKEHVLMHLDAAMKAGGAKMSVIQANIEKWIDEMPNN